MMGAPPPKNDRSRLLALPQPRGSTMEATVIVVDKDDPRLGSDDDPIPGLEDDGTEVMKQNREELLAKATDLHGLDPRMFDDGVLDESFETVKAMPEEEFLEIAEDALPWLTDEQRAMLKKNR